jgi:hypothetical protein
MKQSASPIHVRHQIPRGGTPRRISRNIHARIPAPNIPHVKTNNIVNRYLPRDGVPQATQRPASASLNQRLWEAVTVAFKTTRNETK